MSATPQVPAGHGFPGVLRHVLVMHVLHTLGAHSDRLTRHWPLGHVVLQPVVQEAGGGGEAAARRAAVAVLEPDSTTAAGGGDSEIDISTAGGNCPKTPAGFKLQCYDHNNIMAWTATVCFTVFSHRWRE